ncbi:GNAT family N-acetyltransferase [Chungangia koreensis]|uniref:GNAT family N-acetyltransferase n=1 Tax=Chungangia koreensis TaxID=752657 RepID=A0ABV8X0K4_9LACT
MFVRVVENATDRENAFSIRRRVFVEEQGVPLHLELDELDRTATHFIAYDDDKPIAAGRLRETDLKIGKVERVCVIPEYRGKHIGNLMMKEMERYAAEVGFEKIKLNAQTHAIPFYQKLNYEITSPEFMDAGIPHRAMEKQVSLK